MSLKEILWKFGLTKRKRLDSEVKYEIAVVTAKNYMEEEDYLTWGIVTGQSGLGAAMSEDAEFVLSFRGGVTAFDINDQTLFQSLDIGNRVNLGYIEVFTVTLDYIPPNFDKKQEVSRVLSNRVFVSAEKLT